MNTFFLNIFLALIWIAATGVFTPQNLFIGFVLGFIILYFTRGVIGSPGYIGKVRKAVGLFLFFLAELILANLRVAYDILTPRHLMRPGVIAVPLDARTDAEILILSSMISLTPGTLTLDVSKDRKVLFIHAMYIDNIEEVRRKIKEGFERRLLELMR